MQYAHFNVIAPSDVHRSFPFLTVDQTAAAWVEWLHAYVRRANLAYRSQLQTHYDVVWSAFARAHGLPTDEPLSPYDYPRQHTALQAALTEADYFTHEAAYLRANEELRIYEQNYRASESGVLTDLAQQSLAFLTSMYEHRFHPRYMVEYIDRVWFDMNINTDEAEARRLRSLPYADYLQSEHWTRVKQAMRLIHSAQCQGDACAGMDSYWQDESSLHVHHMHYQNKGRERYNDLRLLCGHCHKRVHTAGVGVVLGQPQRPYIRLPYWIQPMEASE